MPRVKKVQTEEEINKKKYGFRTKEQCEFNPIIINELVPYIAEHRNKLIQVGNNILENKWVSKDEWTYLYDITIQCNNIMCSLKTSAFNMDAMNVKYKEQHSPHYIANGLSHIRYMLNQLNRSFEYSEENEKENGYRVASLYTAAMHIYFFIIFKDKI